MQDIKVWWAKNTSTSSYSLIFIILAIIIRPCIMYAPINYNMHKVSIIKVINNINTIWHGWQHGNIGSSVASSTMHASLAHKVLIWQEDRNQNCTESNGGVSGWFTDVGGKVLMMATGMEVLERSNEVLHTWEGARRVSQHRLGDGKEPVW
jgi:uncharacterized membrane protein YfbV (UPF0208 family)